MTDSQAPSPDPADEPEYLPPPDKDSINLGMLCHLLGIFTYFLGPLIIWLMKKDSDKFVDDQGKEALNFQIAAMIASVACLAGFCFFHILFLAVQIVRLVFGIIASVEASKGVAYRYPLTIRLVK